ncbi:Citrate lyase subunit beta [Alphaproteobacteria bacterium SO-S41]|nr:Citrate lyase subunit beta [Alphaproteobacteria bacterium SO-S41]
MSGLRSFLFVPADSEKKLAKGLESGADALILDLEDAVAEANKPAARATAAAFLKTHAQPRAPQLWVRINPLTTPFADDDLAAIVHAAPDGIALPKPDSAKDLIELDRRLTALEATHGLAPGGIKVLPIATETPASVFNLGTYAGASPRLAALTWGAEDLPAAIGATVSRWEDGSYTDLCRIVRSLCIAGAAAADVPSIETVYPAFKDEDGLRRYAANGRAEGFSGMMAIHPAQVPIINEVFSPSEAELAQAQRVVDLFAANPTAGTLALDGKMLDMPHLKLARRVLESVKR